MDEPTATEAANAALDALLLVVAQSADDLRRFHDVDTRSTVAVDAVSSCDLHGHRTHRRSLGEGGFRLGEVLIGLGLQRPTRA